MELTVTQLVKPMMSKSVMLNVWRKGVQKKPQPLRLFSLSSILSSNVNYKYKSSLTECYSLLEVDAECTENELRSAFLEKVKEYHPDSKSSTSDASKFAQIQEAYKVALDHKRGQAILEEEEKKKAETDDIKHTAPQHRRYLSFDGVGFGSPSKRERQFKQVRVAQAAEAVYEHRIMKHGTTESAVVTKDKAEARKIKISNLIDRVVDDLIRESMQRGEFDNLAGRGKPLDYSSHNPFIDPTTHNINKIMVNNGYKPEWIMLSKEIRDNMALAREKLAIIRERLGQPPYSAEDEAKWLFHTNNFGKSVEEINLKINKFNFIVPFMDKQMVHYDVDRNIEKVVENHKEYLPKDGNGKPLDVSQLGLLPQVKADDFKIRWGEVWFNIKQVFTVR